jgi:hypothetical protein
MSAIDDHDAWANDRDEARTATAHAPQEPPDRPDAAQLLDLADYFTPDTEDTP